MVLLSLWWVVTALAEVRISADARAGNEEMVQIDLPVRRHREYELVTPVSTSLEGRYLSHMLSASHKKRSPRDVSSNPEQLFFNITAFGRGFHLRLKPNTQLVAPGAVVEWYETSPVPGNITNPVNDHQPGSASEGVWRTEPLQSNCAYVGDIVDVPGTSVAISNCDGLVRLIPFECACIWVCVHTHVGVQCVFGMVWKIEV
ncbi:A disintegrin and metalloproteinase with thrombospondin motifs 3-like [Heterocephalus glaber]|uniref:A disintegrin and metalloproteinase with thrombospondin motifs 3-like n=1 Tax=Heterocephalus glaber TaxID=10181 RepID=A0AAX6SIB9_HETGA|nr:A disintegrin and metalloproteinase with thrombospondin motifs 3-like [Heterocephalus glaber]